MTGRTWTDEQLSTFLDGEMPDADARALANDLVEDGALFSRFERLRAANTAFMDTMSAIDARPMPAGVTAALSVSNAAQAAGQGAESVVAFRPRRLGETLAKHRGAAAGLIAAAAMFTVTTAIQPAMMAASLPSAGQMVADNSAFDRALDGSPSAAAVRISADAEVTPRLTFARADGSFCRQYDATNKGARTSSVACREGSGWRVMIDTASGPVAGQGDFTTASGDRSPALEAFLDAEMSGSPLDAAAEAQVIRQGWRP
jgi:hypothetical protein